MGLKVTDQHPGSPCHWAQLSSPLFTTSLLRMPLCHPMMEEHPLHDRYSWPSRYRLVWLVLALGSGGVLLALAHLLLFHVVIICRGVSTYEYILAAQARKQAKLQETHSHVGPLWAWIVPTPRTAKVVPLNVVGTSPQSPRGDQSQNPQGFAPHTPGLQISTP